MQTEVMPCVQCRHCSGCSRTLRRAQSRSSSNKACLLPQPSRQPIEQAQRPQQRLLLKQLRRQQIQQRLQLAVMHPRHNLPLRLDQGPQFLTHLVCLGVVLQKICLP